MPYKVRQTQRDYDREWHRLKREGLPTQIVNKTPQTPHERQLSINRYNHNHRKREKEGIGKILGCECMFCKSIKNPQTHKVDGKPHEMNRKTVQLAEVVKNPQMFVRLCHLCHKAVHWNMKYLGMTWEDILEKANLYNQVK
jgi:hypothetical protein